MRTNLKDITFLILVKLDSIQRLENLTLIIELLKRNFETNLYVREVAAFDSGILKKILNRGVKYELKIDKDPILYKTMHFNEMFSEVKTPYLAIWDVDVIPDANAITEAVARLRESHDVSYPYNGVCLNVSAAMRNLFFKKKNIRFLNRNISKLERLYPNILVGGAVFIRSDKYQKAGMENECHYGWGNDDYDRYYRFLGLGYNIYRVNTPLFHLEHPRGENSSYHSILGSKLSKAACLEMENSSKSEIEEFLAPKIKIS